MKAKIVNLNSTLTKFTKEKENLNWFKVNQICIFERSSLGYNPMKNQKNLTQICLLKHQHLQTYGFFMAKIDFMKNIA